MSLEFKLKRFVSGMGLPATTQHIHWMKYLAPHEAPGILHADVQEQIVEGPLDILPDIVTAMSETNPVDRAMHLDAMTFLDGNGLFQADRMMMAASIEGRVPLLNNLVLDAAIGISANIKLHNGQLKAIIRELLRPHLPQRIIDLPKKGFGPL